MRTTFTDFLKFFSTSNSFCFRKTRLTAATTTNTFSQQTKIESKVIVIKDCPALTYRIIEDGHSDSNMDFVPTENARIQWRETETRQQVKQYIQFFILGDREIRHNLA